MSKDVPPDDLIIMPDAGLMKPVEPLGPSSLRKQFGDNIAEDLPMYWAHWEPRSLEAFAKSRRLYVSGDVLYECPITGRTTAQFNNPLEAGFNKGHILPQSFKKVFCEHSIFFKPYIWIDQEANAYCGRVFDRTSKAMMAILFSHKHREKLERQWLDFADENRTNINMKYGFLFSATLLMFDLYGWEYLISPGGQMLRKLLKDAVNGSTNPAVAELVSFKSMREVALSAMTSIVAFDLNGVDLWFFKVLLPVYYSPKSRRLISLAVLLPGLGEKAVSDFRRVIEMGVPERALAQPRQQVGFGCGVFLEPAFKQKTEADGKRSLEMVHLALCQKPTISHATESLAKQWQANILDIMMRRIDMQAQYSQLPFPRLDGK